MAGYTVGLNSETKAFKQGIESGVIQPLEDAQKELDELGRNKGPEHLERGLKDAQRATDRLADETKDAAREIEREFRDTYRKVKQDAEDAGDGGKRGFGKMTEGAQEVTQEIGANLGEAVSSVRGNLADLGQVGQDTLGGLSATMAGTGPGGLVGAAALAAGAVGLGLVTAELQKQQEEADRFRERISAAYQGAAEDGMRFLDTQALISDGMDLIFNPERADEYKRVLEDATQLGLDRATVIAANTGDLEAQQAVQEQINRLLEDGNSYEATGTTNKKTLKNDVADIRDRWKEVVQTTQEYADKTASANDYTSDMLLKLIDSAGSAEQSVDKLGNKLITFQTENGEMQVLIDAETGQATTNIDKFKGDADGAIDHVNGKKVVIQARAAIDQAQRDLDGFMIRNGGREIKIKGKIVTSGDLPWS